MDLHRGDDRGGHLPAGGGVMGDQIEYYLEIDEGAIGRWALVTHWCGPSVQITRVSPKRVYFTVGTMGGYCDPTDVKALFDSEADAEEGLRRQRKAWADSQEELKVLERASNEADKALNQARRRLKAQSWMAAR